MNTRLRETYWLPPAPGSSATTISLAFLLLLSCGKPVPESPQVATATGQEDTAPSPTTSSEQAKAAWVKAASKRGQSVGTSGVPTSAKPATLPAQSAPRVKVLRSAKPATRPKLFSATEAADLVLPVARAHHEDATILTVSNKGTLAELQGRIIIDSFAPADMSSGRSRHWVVEMISPKTQEVTQFLVEDGEIRTTFWAESDGALSKQLPARWVDSTTVATAALKELAESTAYRAADVIMLARCWSPEGQPRWVVTGIRAHGPGNIRVWDFDATTGRLISAQALE